jgi:uncharacterized membrane protein YhaH (DUF805 family)
VSNGFQEILPLARRPGKPQAVLALASFTVDRDCPSVAFVDVLTGTYDPELGIGPFSGIFALISVIPTVIVYIKRFHDRDKSGWWVLIGLIPLIGAIWLLVELGFLKGTPGPNRFGTPVTD